MAKREEIGSPSNRCPRISGRSSLVPRNLLSYVGSCAYASKCLNPGPLHGLGNIHDDGKTDNDLGQVFVMRV